MPKARKYRELVKMLKRHDKRFEVRSGRGKGSERMLYHPDIGGKRKFYMLKCHGEGDIIRMGHLARIRRRFNLPPDFF